jgi:hypothetical protein
VPRREDQIWASNVEVVYRRAGYLRAFAFAVLELSHEEVIPSSHPVGKSLASEGMIRVSCKDSILAWAGA